MLKKSFTLAEIMITMAIIGVIAALTLPSLINVYENKVYMTKLKKSYSQVVTAAKSAIAEDGANEAIFDENGQQVDITPGFYLSSAGTKDSGTNMGAEYFLKNFLKNNKYGVGGTENLADATYRTPTGTNLSTISNDYKCIKTPDSAIICMTFSDTYRSKIIIDVNGTDKPNVSGIDLFVMKIDDDGSISDLDKEDKCNIASNGDNTLEQYTSGCLSKVVSAGWKLD